MIALAIKALYSNGEDQISLILCIFHDNGAWNSHTLAKANLKTYKNQFEFCLHRRFSPETSIFPYIKKMDKKLHFLRNLAFF